MFSDSVFLAGQIVSESSPAWATVLLVQFKDQAVVTLLSTMGLSVYLYNSAFFVEPKSTPTQKKDLTCSLCHAVSPAWTPWSLPPLWSTGLDRSPRTRTGFFFPHMNNDVTESKEKWRASRQSSHSIWILLAAKAFARAERGAFCIVGMTTSQLMAQPGPLCRSLSVWGLCTQLQACAIWCPIFDRLHAEGGSVEPQKG